MTSQPGESHQTSDSTHDSPGRFPLSHPKRAYRWIKANPARLINWAWRPSVQTDLLQIVKTAIAVVLAWWIADGVLGLAQSFLAPWTAMLTVHATVFRSFSRGAQAVAATSMGVGVAFVVGGLVSTLMAALGVATLLGLLLARLGVLRDEGMAVATTALFVLTASAQDDGGMLADRIFDTLIGVGIGVLINTIVIPPLNDRSAEQQLDRLDRRLGGLLQEMARTLREAKEEGQTGSWIERTRKLDGDLNQAWSIVSTTREGQRLNPRKRTRSAGSPSTYEDVLLRVEDGLAQTRGLARTIDESNRSSQEWDPRFRDRWLDIFEELGRRVEHPDASVASLRESLEDLTEDLSGQELPGLLWPTYGALIAGTHNIIQVVDDVATARPVRT